MILEIADYAINSGAKYVRFEYRISEADGGHMDRIVIEDAIAYPGFINSHDHLDFNLFPSMANRKYSNYTEWAKDIQENNKKEIHDVLKVPEHLRVQWGIYKNLLNGFSKVVNHGKKLAIDNAPICVFQDCCSLHSTAFEKNWKLKMIHPFRNGPYVMHIGEGSDEPARNEIDAVVKWNRFWNKKLIGVHGIAMNARQAEAFEGLVWCPASNYYLIGQTADISLLQRSIKVAFGTDSTLSAGWNAWDHFREIKNKTSIDENGLLDMLTITPSSLWKQNSPQAVDGRSRDLIVMKKGKALFDSGPEDILLVVSGGRVRLYDETLKQQLAGTRGYFEAVGLNGATKYVEGEIGGLVKKIKSYYPSVNIPITV